MATAAKPRVPLAGLAAASTVVAGVTGLLYPLSSLDPGVSSGVLYVLGVLLVTLRWGLWVGLLTSAASAGALGVFHGDLRQEADIVAVGVLLLTATVASVIADRARTRAEDAEERLRLEEELRASEAERIRLREVRASRARVLAAADAERQRIARDLHDGAQQRLVHAVVTLKLARGAIEPDPPGAEALVDEALDQTQRATTEIRALAHGILPAVLTRGGLSAGVDALVSGMPVPVAVDVAVGRLAPAIEATAYFVVAESLTNVVKHALATRAAVSVAIDNGLLRVIISDDGVGGARPDGSGLLGLDDRLSALEGRLRVESPPRAGTVVTAVIPLAETEPYPGPDGRAEALNPVSCADRSGRRGRGGAPSRSGRDRAW